MKKVFFFKREKNASIIKNNRPWGKVCWQNRFVILFYFSFNRWMKGLIQYWSFKNSKFKIPILNVHLTSLTTSNNVQIKSCASRVNTQYCFNVHLTFITFEIRWIDVQIKSCVTRGFVNTQRCFDVHLTSITFK